MRSFFIGLSKRLKGSGYKDAYNLLKSSGVNWKVYQETIHQDFKDPIQCFLERYREFPLVVENYFDSSYYLKNNPDVEQSDANPLVHFLLYGGTEGRAGYFDDTEAVIQQGIIEDHGEVKASKIFIDVEGSFGSDEITADEVIDVQKSIRSQTGLNPIKYSGKDPSLREDILKLNIEWPEVFEELAVSTVDAALDVIIERSVIGQARVAGFFDQQLYESIYPDIKKDPINALEHYVRHGLAEGRSGWLDPENFFEPGGKCYVQNRDTVLVVSHDATATGAPVVALEVADRFSEKYNIMTVVLKGGALRERFVQAGCLHLDAPVTLGVGALRYLIEHILQQHSIKAVVLNSVESMPFLDAAAALGLPTVSLLHEFSEYTRPIGKMSHTLYTADIVIYPAETLKQSGLREFKEKTGAENEPNNIWIQPQGYLGFKSDYLSLASWSLRDQLGLDEHAIVIIGAGHVQPRKGVDWFLETCWRLYQNLKDLDHSRAEDLQFVWLGNGFHEDDTLVSVWLETFMQKTNIRERCHFPGAVQDVSAAFAEADIYLLTSRLDPFPNVAIDAINQDCAIGVFDGASGIVDFVIDNNLRSVIAPYGDTYKLAENLANDIDSLIVKDGGNAEACEKCLNFNDYIKALESAVEEACERQRSISQVIDESDVFACEFDSDFYRLNFSDGNPARHFLNLLYKGIVFSKPFPGSDILSYAASNPYDSKETFIDYVERALRVKVEDMPVHKVTGLAGDKFRGSIAIQFHVYYNDLIPEYCEYFKTLIGHNVDLYVSYINDLTDTDLKTLKLSISGKVSTCKVDNVGRDVYPFHNQFIKNILGHYDVVGHFHTKKSRDIADGTGDRWRTYLLGNLLGSVVAAREILALFNDSDTGLVFAEDSHCISETLNGPYIEGILEQVGYERRTNYRNFPLGTMFWARVEALQKLGEISQDTFRLKEPIPYDGTSLHAFERIVPQLVQEAGYKIQRVYTAGTYW